MARSERDIFNDHVAALVRQLGLDLEALSTRRRQSLLDQVHQRARDGGLNDHESALAAAYGHVAELLDDDVERARVLVDRIALMAREWHADDLVNRALVAPLEREARERVRRAHR